MFESCANFNGSTVGALKMFCSVANPAGRVFHLISFFNLVERNEKKRGGLAKFFNQSSSIAMMVRFSYESAIKRHLRENPSGPYPNQMTFKDFPGRRYSTIQYRTVCGTRIQVEIMHPDLRNTFPPRLVVFGTNRYEVWKRAELAGLPEPVYIPPVFAGFTPTRNPLVQVTMSIDDLVDILYPLW